MTNRAPDSIRISLKPGKICKGLAGYFIEQPGAAERGESSKNLLLLFQDAFDHVDLVQNTVDIFK